MPRDRKDVLRLNARFSGGIRRCNSGRNSVWELLAHKFLFAWTTTLAWSVIDMNLALHAVRVAEINAFNAWKSGRARFNIELDSG